MKDDKGNLSAAISEIQTETTNYGVLTRAVESNPALNGDERGTLKASENKIKAVLRARLGEEVYSSWFSSMELEEFVGDTVHASVPVKFLRRWIQNHYLDDVLAACQTEFPDAERVEVALRQPVSPKSPSKGVASKPVSQPATESTGTTLPVSEVQPAATSWPPSP
ncbi:MAG: hypothetical protein KKB37_12435, partial [Alphaproteobacteria bacterium]|nr:hypothetical protein [Alphaproteobacteria bacterium]